MSQFQNQKVASALQHDAQFDLEFRVMLPQPNEPKSLVVLLHGVGSNESSVIGLSDGLGPDTLVVAPRGPLILGPNQAAWFRVAFTATGPKIVEAEAEQARLTLIHFVQQLQKAYRVTPQKTVIAGFSQGGIMSASVALSEPELVAGFGLLSGRILPELTPHIASVDRLKNQKAFVGHGDVDSKLPVSWAEKSDQLLKDLQVSNESHRYPIDHTVSEAMHADLINWVRRVLN